MKLLRYFAHRTETMSKSLTVETRLTLSKSFRPGESDLALGRYTLKPLPPIRPGETEAILVFDDAYESPVEGGSHPEEEASILCVLLSLLLETRVKRSGLRLNHINIPPTEATTYARYRGHLVTEGIEANLDRILCLPIDLARQLARSCRAYSSAIDLIPSEPTFAFFLLVVAVECLSSQRGIIPFSELDADSKCERFCLFVRRYLPATERGDDERDEGLLNNLLKTVYYSHRSAFVHGGKEVSYASLLADGAGSSYFKHSTDGKEVLTPGLGWFARIVRGAIMGYIASIPVDAASHNIHLLAALAAEKSRLRMKAKRDVKAGQPVTLNDVDYR